MVVSAFIQLEGLVSLMAVLHKENENSTGEGERIFSAAVGNLGELGLIGFHLILCGCLMTRRVAIQCVLLFIIKTLELYH